LYIANEHRYDAMQYRRTGKSGVQLPAISLGLWHNFGGVDVFETGRAMVRRAFDLGITHFDLANTTVRRRAAPNRTLAKSCASTSTPTATK